MDAPVHPWQAKVNAAPIQHHSVMGQSTFFLTFFLVVFMVNYHTFQRECLATTRLQSTMIVDYTKLSLSLSSQGPIKMAQYFENSRGLGPNLVGSDRVRCDG